MHGLAGEGGGAESRGKEKLADSVLSIGPDVGLSLLTLRSAS